MDTKQLTPAGKRIPPNAGKGRKAGSLNKITKTIKQAIEEAFKEVGGADYLVKQAKENPQAFMTLLGKIIPAQVQTEISNPDGSLKPTIVQIVAANPKPNDNSQG